MMLIGAARMDKPDLSLSPRPTVRGQGVRYPESDGKPMGETGVHVEVIFSILGMLWRYFRGRRVAILSNMFLYYEEGNPKKVVCPDVFVTLNVPRNRRRRTFKVWQEGKGPDLVIEVTSKKTKKEDLGKKFELYRDVLKVREYFLFDPLEEYLEPPFQGFRLVEGRYEPIPRDEFGISSSVLGLRLEREDTDLRFWDPQSGKRIPTVEELDEATAQAEAARRDAEAARQDAEAARTDAEAASRIEAAARQRAEAEVQRLQREIEELRRRTSEEKA